MGNIGAAVFDKNSTKSQILAHILLLFLILSKDSEWPETWH